MPTYVKPTYFWPTPSTVDKIHTCLMSGVLFFHVDIDFCINATCKNGASCVDGRTNYTCSCPVGFTGDLCETGIIE